MAELPFINRLDKDIWKAYPKKIAIYAMQLESVMMSMFKASATLVMAKELNHIGILITLLTRKM